MSGAVFFPKKTASTGAAPITAFMPPIPSRFTALVPAHEDVVNGFIRDTELIAPLNINQWTIYNTQNTGGPNAVTATLGAMTTAPDGTNTAQKIIEAATTSGHYLTAVQPYGVFGPTGPWRFAVFAKAAERTRIVLEITGGSNTAVFVKTVFDLANGVVAVAGTSGNNSAGGAVFASVSDGILAYPNGWYLCWIDVTLFSQFGMICYFKLDSGTGNAAESSSYLGDVTKGLYAWTTSFLPADAFGMSGQVEFFDDFNDNTMSNFDLTDARDPTKTWFLHNTIPYLFGLIPNPSVGMFSVANSALRGQDPGGIHAFNQQGQGMGVATVGWLGPNLGGFIDQGQGAFYDLWNSGRTYAIGEVKAYPSSATGAQGTALYISLINSNLNNQPDISPSAWSVYVSNDGVNNGDPSTPGPGFVGRTFSGGLGLLETKQRWPLTTNINIGIGVNIYPAYWLTNVQDVSKNVFSSQYRHYDIEDELTEVFNQSSLFPIATKHAQNLCSLNDQNSVQRSTYGYYLWDSVHTFVNNFIVSFNGTLYKSLQDNNLNHEPDLTLGVWWALASDPLSATSPPNANIKVFDQTAYHVYARLKCPVNPKTNTGIILTFMDGVFCQPTVLVNQTALFPYGPATSTFTRFDLASPCYHVGDGIQIFLTINAGVNPAGGVGADTDFIRLTR